MKNKLIVLLALALVTVIASTALTAEKDRMKVVFSPYDFNLDVVVAMEKGYFDILGLEFEPQSVKGGSAVIISLINSGEVNGCFLASPTALTAITKGVDLVQVAGIGHRAFDFYAAKDSPVKSIQDFAGKKIANYPKPSGPWLALKYDLDQNKIEADVQNIRGDDFLAGTLITGKVDVAFGDPFFESQFGDQLKLVHTSTISKYLYNSCGWWFKKDYLEKNHRAVKKFVDGMLMGRLFINQNRDEAIRILAKHRGLKIEEFKSPLRLPVFDLPVTVYQYGLAKTNEIMQQYEILDQKVDVSKCVSGDFAILIDQDY